MKEVSTTVKAVSLILAVVLAGSWLAGCQQDPRQAQREALQARLNTLNGESASAQQTVSDQQSTLEGLRQRLSTQRAGLTEYNAGVQSYMLQHKMAVAAIVAGVAGSVAWIENNGQYSEDAKNLGLAITAVAVIWAVQNMDEVSEVLGTLNEADAHVKTLQAEISQTASSIDQQQANLQQMQSRAADLSQQTASARADLSSL